MKIYSKSGIEILDIQVDDSSVRHRSIMSDDSLTLKFSHTATVSIPVGSYVIFEGQRYTLWLPENFKKHNTRNFEYTIVLGGWREALKLFKFKDLSSVPYRLKFSLTARPADFLQLLVDNMNEHDSGWSMGSYIDASERTMSFNHEYCYDALLRIVQEWTTEFEIVGKTIHLRKVEKYKTSPLALSYGKGNGFKSGVGRSNDGDKQPIGRLYVQGGERNIDFSKYGSRSLLLPKSEVLVVDGKTYRTDAHGMYIKRDGNDLIAEDSFDATSIYPKRVGTVSEVIVVDEEKSFYDIIDNSIPEELDYTQHRIDGDKATIIFQSGPLSGREFDIEQTDKALTGYVHEERRFKIVPQELDGVIMPGGAFVPAVGDKYAIFNISMPDSYIERASLEMFQECVKYFAIHEKQKFSFTGELDGIWAKSKWLEIGGKIVPGGHVLFSDEQFMPNGEVIRITAVKDYVNFPHKPEITLSNAPIPGGLSTTIGEIEGEEVANEEERKRGLQYTKRRWRDLMETMSMLEDAILDFDSSINPISVRTMQMIVGDESLQFRFVTSKSVPKQTTHSILFDNETKVLTASAGIIQHMTLGITKMSSAHKVSDYLFWTMAQYTPPPLEAAKSYYLYAKCSKSTGSGVFLLSETAIEMDSVAGYYHLLVGIINSEYNGERSIVTLYGFTEILPGRVTTDRIVSSDGKTYFDLVNGVLAGRLRFINSNGDYQDVSGLKDGEPGIDGEDGLTVVIDPENVFVKVSKSGTANYVGTGVTIVLTQAGERLTHSTNGMHTTPGYYKATIVEANNVVYPAVPIMQGNQDACYIASIVNLSAEYGSAKIVLDGVTSGGKSFSITKSVAYRKVRDGGDGTDGTDGDDGVSIVKVEEQYYRSTSSTELIGGSWDIVVPEWIVGTTIWQRFKVYYSSGAPSYTVAQPYSSVEALQKVNIAKAITDKFGTTIDGGLINTVTMLLREANSQDVTAGISGIQGTNKDNPAVWAGGTYQQAIALISFLDKIKNGIMPDEGEYASLAKNTQLHNGATKLGDFLVFENGAIVMVDPATANPRLIFNVLDLPSIEDLVGGVSSTGTISVGSGSTSTSQRLSGTATVSQPNGTGQRGAVTITLSASGKKQLSGLSSFASAELNLYVGSTKLSTLGSASLFFTTDLDEVDVATTTIPAGSLFLSGVDDYYFKLEIVKEGNVAFTSGFSTGFTFSWDASLAGVKRQQYGRDGMMFFYSNNHFHYTEGNGLDIRGKTNMPGVLAGGSVATNGGQTNKWGAKVGGSASIITGGYRVPLVGMSHGNYSVQVTPHTATTFRISTKTSTYFEVLGTGAFDYSVIGSNY